MGSGMREKQRSKTSAGRSSSSVRNPKKQRFPLGPKTAKTKAKSRKTKKAIEDKVRNDMGTVMNQKPTDQCIVLPTVSQQLDFFIHQYQSANGIQLSPLELESITDTCLVELSPSLVQSASNLGQHMKAAFGSSGKEMLCEKQLVEGQIDLGSPALLVISLSALRSLELLRGLHPLTRECPAAKLFSKHMKVEDQVSFLKKRVNIASGTPSRIKKLIDMEALGLTQLKVVVLDMHSDVKGYSLFTLPQVRDEFWDLYKSYFHQRLLQSDLRICLYGPLPSSSYVKKKVTDD